MSFEPLTRDEAVGKAIAFVRDLRGTTQQELADALEISKRTLGDIESGRRALKATERMGIAHVLNVPLSWIEEPPFPPTVEVATGPYSDSGEPAAHNGVARIEDGSSRRGAQAPVGADRFALRAAMVGDQVGPDDDPATTAAVAA